MSKASKSEVALQGFVWTKIYCSQGHPLKYTKFLPICIFQKDMSVKNHCQSLY